MTVVLYWLTSAELAAISVPKVFVDFEAMSSVIYNLHL